MGSLAASSNKVTLRSVDIEVEFNVISTATGVASSVQYEICDLGKFIYDFAVTTDVDDIDKIGIRAGSVSISFFDNPDADHYQSIYDAYFDGTSTLITGCQIKIYNPSGAASADIIKCTFSNQDITYDINQRKTTINFQPLKPSDVSVDSIEDLIANSDSQTYGNIDPEINFLALPVPDFISDALDDIYGSAGTSIVISNFDDTPTQGEFIWWVFDDKQDSETGVLTAPEQLANIAGVEGSVFGNMLGKKVYFARNVTGSQTVTMSESDFKSLKLETPPKSKYRELKVTHGSLTSTSTSAELNSSADKTANFSFRKGNVAKREVTADGPIFYSYGSSDVSDATVAAIGVAAYEKVLLDTPTPTLSGTFFEVNKVLPHECMVISFGDASTGATRLINPLNGTYRFSKVTYDLVKDTVDFEAYKIA